MASSSSSTRRKHEAQGDTPGKPAVKKKHDNRGRRRKQLFTETQKTEEETEETQGMSQQTQEYYWSSFEKKCLIAFFYDKGASHWPTHQHKPGSSDIWSECAAVVSKKTGIMRTAGSCRLMVYNLKKSYYTPDIAMDEFHQSDDGILASYQKLEGEDERMNIVDDLFHLQLQERNLDEYSPPNVPSLCLLAMEKLKGAKRPNAVAHLLECLTGEFESGKQRLDIDRMPYPLLETNLQFFASEHLQQVSVHPTYHQWLGTMYAQFGERFLALFTGPMWKYDKHLQEDENEELHHQVLTTALRSHQPSSPTPLHQASGFTTSTPVPPSTFWNAADSEEIEFTQAEGGNQDSRQREKDLLHKHGLQTQYRKRQQNLFKTKDALVNVVGLSPSQLRKDFAKTEYTPGPSIQKRMLQQAHKEIPTGKWWIKADACDLSRGLRESMTNEWSGDVDWGDGKLQLLHAKYKNALRNISTMVLADLQEHIKQLEDEVPEIEKGLSKAKAIYDEKKKAGMVGARLQHYAWELQGWRDLKQQNKELRQYLTAAFDGGKIDDITTLKVQLQKYQKAIYTKRRTMATHLLIFMISDELRNRKPYAVPVRIMPITTAKDATMRKLQNEVKDAMEEIGMKVVGFVTDGEWNSLRTMGTTRPTSLIQLVMEAKREAAKITVEENLELIFDPKIELNKPAVGQITISAKKLHEAVPHEAIRNIGVDIVLGHSLKTALHNQHKKLYIHTPNPLPWVPGTSEETQIECERSLLATYIFRAKVKYWKAQGVDFTTNLYVPDQIHDREDHGHLLKRIVKCVRLGHVEDADVTRWIEALQDERTMLTASAVRGVDAQSVPDCERMFSKGVIDFFEEKGYDREAKFAKLLHNWHKATDGRGLSEKERHDYNMAMLDYILDDWIPGHKYHKDFSQVDVNKPLKGIRGLTRETIIGLTTNISSQELRRQEKPPEHPRASTSDCCESFIAILHHMLGRTFDFKAFNNAYRKIFTEHEKMMDSELPFYYYRSPRGRFTTDPLPDFNMPSSSGVERLDRVRGSRFGHPGTSLPSRSRMPRHGGRTIRDACWRKEEAMPSLHLDT